MHGPRGGPHSPLLPENDLVKRNFQEKSAEKKVRDRDHKVT